jgi:hypothetical protein
MTTPPEQFVVPVPEISWVMGLPPFIVLSDIYDVPGIDGFVVTAITDSYCMLSVDWERTNPPANPGQAALSGTVTDAGPLINHTLVIPEGSLAQQPRQQIAQEVRYTIRLADADTSGRELRPYIGTLKLRQTPWNFVPVRFYEFGGNPPPPPGGDEGFWNTYAWAQYNPNGQPFTFTNYAYLDLNATNGTEILPALRIMSRYVQPTGTNIQVQLSSPAPDSRLQQALFQVWFDGTLVERFAWDVPRPGEVEPIERFIREVDQSRYIRPIRLLVNPSQRQSPTFLGPNYWLVDRPQSALVFTP